jgi:hypothetical protein
MEKCKRARRRKPETAKADLKPPLAVLRRAGCHREVESEGHEEKHRAEIEGAPRDEPVGQRWARSSLRFRDEGPTAPRCLRSARYGRPARSGGLAGSPVAPEGRRCRAGKELPAAVHARSLASWKPGDGNPGTSRCQNFDTPGDHRVRPSTSASGNGSKSSALLLPGAVHQRIRQCWIRSPKVRLAR